ncbi:MAG: IMS domain-containing protein, partial [Thermoanaerobaculia bacterium]
LAAQKEIAAIEKRISDLADQGRILDPTFRQLTVEEVTIFNYANAYVTTVEVWDLRSLATGSREQLAEDIGQSTRVKYQLKREGGGWKVLFRAKQG